MSSVPQLSTARARVLQEMALGLSNAEIATKLHIEASTVKSHIATILRQLNASNRAQAVVIGLRHGFISFTGEHHHPPGQRWVIEVSRPDGGWRLVTPVDALIGSESEAIAAVSAARDRNRHLEVRAVKVATIYTVEDW